MFQICIWFWYIWSCSPVHLFHCKFHWPFLTREGIQVNQMVGFTTYTTFVIHALSILKDHSAMIVFRHWFGESQHTSTHMNHEPWTNKDMMPVASAERSLNNWRLSGNCYFGDLFHGVPRVNFLVKNHGFECASLVVKPNLCTPHVDLDRWKTRMEPLTSSTISCSLASLGQLQ